MNSVCFVYEYENEIWSTPLSIMNEFKRRGFHVERCHLSKSNFLDLIKNTYDIIIVMDWKGIDVPSNIHTKLPLGTFKVRENADTPQNYDKHVSFISRYNLILTPDYESSLKYEQAGAKCLWFNHFADTDIHKDYGVKDLAYPVRSTRGPGGSQFMDGLSQIMPTTFLNRNGLVGEDYGKFLSEGVIVLQNSRWKEITRRIFEGMACGKLVITDRLPKSTKIDTLFVENQDIVYYDNISDCISKINYYLWDKEEAARIASNGYKKVLENHTQKQRVDSILKEYEKWKKKFKLSLQ